MPDSNPTPQTAPLGMPAWIYDLVNKGITGAGLAAIAWLLLQTVLEQSKNDRVMFQKVSEDDRVTFNTSLKLIQESTDKRTERMASTLDKAVEEMRKASERNETLLKAIEKSARTGASIRPVSGPDGQDP